MHFYSLLLLVFVLEVAVSDDVSGMRLTTETTESLKTEGNTQYRFHYFVKDDTTGDYKIQEETKKGDSVQGSYTLAEPNGDLRTVTYTAGPGKGFEAKVSVQPSGSPVKQTTEEESVTKTVTASPIKTTSNTQRSTTMKSKIKHFPGGFLMDILSKPQSNVKTEMGMKFSVKTNSVSPPITDLTTTATAVEMTVTEVPKNTEEITQRINGVSTPENSSLESPTFLTEGREISEDQIEKEIDEAINSMPKLPELVLSDNKTHFKLHKDPEEALLDERITQIARQLAETSLRREYEERKLGHFIPISVSSIEPSSISYFSKSLKFTRNDSPRFTPSEPNSLHVLSQPRVPQYVYKQTLIPKVSPIRLPVVSSPFQNTQTWEQQTDEAITNPPDILKITKLENKPTEIKNMLKGKDTKYDLNYETTETQPISVMPIHVPTFFQFFSPYVVHSPKSYVTPQQPVYTSTVKKDLTAKGLFLNDATPLYPLVKMLNDKTPKKL